LASATSSAKAAAKRAGARRLTASRRFFARHREALFGFLFISPWIIGFVVFTAGPMIASLLLSFTDWSILGSPHWVGTENYSHLLNDPLFWKSMRVTFVFSAISVPLDVLASLLLALLLNQAFRGRALFRALFYIPELMPAVATAILWIWAYNTHFGIFNYLLSLVGLPQVAWLEDTSWVIPSFIILSLWTSGGSRMIIFLAGLQTVPKELLEAANLDGAGVWARFRNVTLPMISPVLLFNLILTTIGAFQVFTSAYVMTAGGPANSSLFYVLYLYRNAFQYMSMGYASALAWVLFLVLLIFTILQFRMMRKWVYYEGEVR
jgi:multiple sugar transport system permease protein